jgi:selenocysteine-specific elongation factor
MTAPLILGTAGHIDHGKTALIRALTGIDADRLPEERLRGMTIDLGFAFTEIADRRLGIVDVPGHERFIRNMVAGATGIDLVLLVVAADDAVMPQTREHLEIIDLLGVRGGVVALNKIDLVDEHRLESARSNVLSLLKGTCLEGSPIVPVSAVTGSGIEALRDAIAARITTIDWPAWPALFRMPIDRRFSMKGHGTVVTGSLLGGDIHPGDEVELWPHGKKVRARAVQSHGAEHESVHSGRRVAVNLPNIKVRDIERGNELAAPGYLRPAQRLAVRLRCLGTSPLAVSPAEEFRLHIGTSSLNARFATVGHPELEPGAEAFALMQTESPVCGAHGQRFIFRSSAHGITVGGGEVLFTRPPLLDLKASPPDWLVDLGGPDPDRRILAALAIDPALGALPAALFRETGVEPADASARLRSLAHAGRILQSGGKRNTGYWTRSYVDQAGPAILAALHALLDEMRPRLAIPAGMLIKAAVRWGDADFIHWMLERLRDEGRVDLQGDLVRLKGYDIHLKEIESRDFDSLLQTYAEAGLAPATNAEMAARAGLSAARANAFHLLAVDRGDLVELNAELTLHGDVHEALLGTLRDLLSGARGLTVSEIKDRLGITRKHAIPLCEHLDRRGYTRREGDVRFAGPNL